jgi:hypothetical protein
MPPIAQANVTVFQTPSDEDYIGQRTNMMTPKMSFGNGVLTYDTYGIPLPNLNAFRLKTWIRRLFIQPTVVFTTDSPPHPLIFWYDPTPRAANPVAPNGTIRILDLHTLAEFSGAPPAISLFLEIWGS